MVDLILHSGRVWDGADLPGVEAVAIADGRIEATGSSTEILALASEQTRRIDADGRRIMPGLIDSHIHMVRGGLRWKHEVRWNGLTSLDTGLGLLASAAAGKEPGEWTAVLGGWNPHQFEESRPPSRDQLDEAVPESPVFIQRNYIEAFLNTKALEELGWAGVDAPQWVELDPDSGSPTGRVVGVPALQALGQRLIMPDHPDQVEGTRALLRELNRVGLTGAVDAGGFRMVPEAYRPITELYESGEKGFRVRLLVGASQPDGEDAEIERWMELVAPGSGDAFLRYLGAGEVVLFPAHDVEGLDGRDVSAQRDRLAEMSRRFLDAGWPLHLHAILDRSIGTVLDAWEQAGKGQDLSRLRYTITHADQISDHNLGRVRDIGLGLTVQNGMAFRGNDSIPTWGEDLVRRSPPLRDIVDSGIPVGAGTDGTVVSNYNPWPCVWWMTTGRSSDGAPDREEEQRLTIDEALRLYTSGSAWFSFEEDSRGNLRPGSHADLVVLSADPLAVPEDRIPGIESVLTIVGGAVVHTASGR